ncbi:MAG: addiction module toxin RelE [Desulfobulbaceae bacterium A2]|nr:MAG: addiction module toxin RelE [Desulfobulbaceae bacterium A2]
MASYNILWKQSAAKELKRLDRTIISRVTDAVEALANDPHPDGCRKLQGAEHLWRIRIGDYRVIYSVDAGVLCIEVIKVAHRQSAYRP